MSDRELSQRILELAGGKENISKAAHCITRLRLYIIDESKFDKEKIAEELGLQVMVAGGQHQVIIGPGKVERIYDNFIEVSGLDRVALVEDDKTIDQKGKEFQEKETLFNRFVSIISGIFQPMLGLLAGTGMIKGLTAILLATSLISADSTTYLIMNAIGDTFFMGLPVFVGYYTMRMFKGTPMMGAAIGLVLINPAITALGGLEPIYTIFSGTPFAIDVQATLFGLPISVGMIGYQYAVIPTIIIVWMASKFERFAKKISHDSISLFFISFFTILVSSILGLVILGPIFSLLTSLLNSIFANLLVALPVITGFILGGLWQILVMFGLHWALVPLGILQIGELAAGNIDKMNVLASTFGASFSVIGSVLAVMTLEKSKKTNAMAVPAFITGLFGITEPSIYGVLIPRKIPFTTACIGGAISGAFLSGVNNGAYSTGGLGIFKLPTFINPNVSGLLAQTDLWTAIIGALIAFVSAYILTIVMYKKKVKEQYEISK